MIIKLIKLRIENFKGLHLFESEWDGESVNGYGENATGKTTLVDAFQWCLFDKNSEGNSKFGIKPIDKYGNERHHLDTSVELTLGLDDKQITLKKIYKEKWTKKNGEEEKEFTGHTAEYYIDGTPKPLKDYKAKVSEIVEEDVFKMLTNVMYFNGIDWKKRRDIIMSLCPQLSDDEILKTNPELEPLRTELARKSIEDIETTEKHTKSNITDKLKTIPARIDELSKVDYSMVEGLDQIELKSLIKTNEDKLQEIKVKKANLGNGNEIINLETEIKKMSFERMQLTDFKSPKIEKLEVLRQDGQNLRVQKQTQEMAQRDLESKINRLNQDLKYNVDLRQKLYDEYDKEFAKVFHADNCSLCGQALPKEKVDELEKHFNTHKVEAIDSIVARGNVIKADIERLQKEIDKTTQELEFAKDEVKRYDDLINSKLFEYNQVRDEPEENPNKNKIDDIVLKMQKYQEKLSNLKTGYVANPYEQEENQLRDEIVKLNYNLVKLEQKVETEKRIEELTEERKKASSDYSKSEKVLILCDKFKVTKANLLEEHINNNFGIVKFKMFDNQINGGISETCVATVDGVPFADLNNAKKINAGLDIIKGLQKVYGITAPIFVDNAESVTSYIEVPNTQFIKLYVKKGIKKLEFYEEEGK